MIRLGDSPEIVADANGLPYRLQPDRRFLGTVSEIIAMVKAMFLASFVSFMDVTGIASTTVTEMERPVRSLCVDRNYLSCH